MPIHDWSAVEAGVFHDFHHELITAVKHTLNSGVFPEGYYAMADQVIGPGHPDVVGLQRPPSPERAQLPAVGGSTTALLADPTVRYQDAVDRTKRRLGRRKRVSVRHITGDRVVALVEIVSPLNKDGTAAARAFAERLADYLDEGIHLLMVDLLRPGRADPNGIHPLILKAFKKKARFTLPPDQPLTLAAYAAGDPIRAFVEPAAIGGPLPDMPLFLTPEYHVLVPLEASYAAAWAMVPTRWRDVLAE